MEAALPKPRVQHRAGGGVLALIFHFKMCVECFCILATAQLWSFEGASFWVNGIFLVVLTNVHTQGLS